MEVASCRGRFALTNRVSPDFISPWMCTANPACQLEKGRPARVRQSYEVEPACQEDPPYFPTVLPNVGPMVHPHPGYLKNAIEVRS